MATMDVIRARCPQCGDITLLAPDVTLRICDDDGSAAYWFRCPGCDRRVSRGANPRVFDLLQGVGVPIQRWHLPSELFEQRAGAPLTPDDLLDFHLQLTRTNWFDDLVASLESSDRDDPLPRS